MTTPFPFVAGQVLTAAQLNSISELPTRTLTANGDAVAADRYSRVILNGTSITYTVNSATFDVGEVVNLYNANSTTATIAAGTGGVTINGAAGLTLAQYQSAQLYAISATSFLLWKSDTRSGVLQVLSTAKNDTFSTTSNTYVDVTGLSVTITPSSTSNKVLVVAQINAGLNNTADANAHFKLVGGNTASYLPATAGNRTLAGYTVRARAAVYEQGYWGMDNGVIQYLDSPATTSATTYKIQMIVHAGTGYVNRGGEDVDVATISRLSSSITVTEVTA